MPFGSPAASLRESFLDALLDRAVDDAFAAIDLDGRVLEGNRGAEIAFGWSAAEAVGRGVDVLFRVEAVADLPASQVRAARDADAAVAIEGWQRRRNGTVFWSDGKLMPLRGGVGTAMDIERDRTGAPRGGVAPAPQRARLRRRVAGRAGVACRLRTPLRGITT